jgi:hypothetical protein
VLACDRHDREAGAASGRASASVAAVGLLSVPYAPPGGPRPTDAFAKVGGAEEFYVSYFQTPGRAEAEIELDVRGWLAGFYAGLSGGAPAPQDGGSLAGGPGLG